MAPKWWRLAGLAREGCALWFQFFGAVFASKGYPFQNIFLSFLVFLVSCHGNFLRKIALLVPHFGIDRGDYTLIFMHIF